MHGFELLTLENHEEELAIDTAWGKGTPYTKAKLSDCMPYISSKCNLQSLKTRRTGPDLTNRQAQANGYGTRVEQHFTQDTPTGILVSLTTHTPDLSNVLT